MDNKTALKKLFKIAKNQQKILEKLAQERAVVPNSNDTKSYLERAVSTAVANSGIASTYHTNVSENAARELGNGITADANYVVQIQFTPALTDNNVKSKLLQNLKSYISNNR